MKLHRWVAEIALSTSGSILLGHTAQANPIVPQAESLTQVQQIGNEFTITGGVSSGDGQTLIHGFEQLGLTQGQIATFLAQPEVRSILSRVVGGEASYIDGLLRVAGSSADLYLINPAGLLFGPNAQLDLAGSFAATTATGVSFNDAIFNVMGDSDGSRLVGEPTGFVFAVDDAGAIVNAADLAVTTGASIALIGGQVISTGSLTAPDGEITIAAIPAAGLVRISHPDMVLNLEVATVPEDAIADAATLTPLSLPALLTGTPAALATGLSMQPDGTVALVATDTPILPGAGTAIATGELDVSSSSGGAIAMTGDRVALLNAQVNAAGEFSGGTVRIGGDFQGQSTLPGSSLTYVDEASTITASAGGVGDGGTVILWSDGTTAFDGDIAANGGTTSGDGGFVEVSGAATLIYDGTVSAIAPNGQVGTLLLDPTNITIRNGTNDGDDSDLSSFLLTEFNIAATDPLPTILYESELENSPGNIDLAIRASNNITIENLADDALTFQTDGVAPGSITFEAGGAFQMLDLNDVIEAPRRSLTINANTIIAGGLDTSDPSDFGGDVGLTASGAIATGDINTLGDAFTTGSGDVTITGSRITTGRIQAGGGFLNTSRVALTATADDIVVDTISAGGGGLEINAPRRFQAREVFEFDPFLRITLNSTDDAALIDFLMRGDPQPLIDAGLVDTTEQVFVSLPTSILVSPDTGGGPIVIRHGGSSANNFSNGSITIIGSGAFPDIQFVSGPNDDHAIDIDPAVPTASFTNFTTLFPPGTFPDEASGTIGAILRGQGDATLVTSFQNQPFVPTPVNPETPAPTTNPPVTTGNENPLRGPTTEPTTDTTGNFETLANLGDDDEEETAEFAVDSDSEALSTEEVSSEDCEAAIASRTNDQVEIDSTCAVPEAIAPSE